MDSGVYHSDLPFTTKACIFPTATGILTVYGWIPLQKVLLAKENFFAQGDTSLGDGAQPVTVALGDGTKAHPPCPCWEQLWLAIPAPDPHERSANPSTASTSPVNFSLHAVWLSPAPHKKLLTQTLYLRVFLRRSNLRWQELSAGLNDPFFLIFFLPVPRGYEFSLKSSPFL